MDIMCRKFEFTPVVFYYYVKAPDDTHNIADIENVPEFSGSGGKVPDRSRD